MEKGDASSHSRRSPNPIRVEGTSRDASYYSSRTSTVIDTVGLWTTSIAAKKLGGLF